MKNKANILISLALITGASFTFLVGCETNEPTPDPISSIKMVEIPAGTFTMGSPEMEVGHQSDEEQHVVAVAAFRMSKYEITNTQYAAFLNDKSVDRFGGYPKGAAVTECLIRANTNWGVWYSDDHWLPVDGYENHPVVDVPWFGANEFAKYVGGRLPTDAEWEYACRANTMTAFNTGVCLGDRWANYDWKGSYPYYTYTCTNASTTSPGKTQRVGTYPANAFGLSEMHGNAWEWCDDLYQGDPELRVLRGGSWSDEGWRCRSADRSSGDANQGRDVMDPFYGNVGFRVVADQ
jgi:sulfatase modifying factor 1